MLWVIVVYLRDITDTFSSSFALKCKSSEHLLSLYSIQLMYIPNLYFTDMTHVDWALKKAVIYPVLLHVTIFMVMGD